MNEHYPFVNVPLPYAYNAMEPYIDAKTMELHHNKHLQTYIDNLNSALSKYPQFQDWSLEELLVNVPSLPEDIQTSVKTTGAAFTAIGSISQILQSRSCRIPKAPYTKRS